MCYNLFICKGPTSFRKYKPVNIDTVKITQKEHQLIWDSETTQNLNVYLYNYETETNSYLKNNYYGMQLFKFL